MTKTTADLVEEALGLLERGELRLETGPQRYGAAWAEMLPVIQTALQVNQASQPPLVSNRPFTPLDKAAGWQTLRAQLEVAKPAPVTAHVRRPAAPKPSFLEVLAGLFTPTVRRVGGMIAVAVLFFGLLGFTVSNALPGNWLYPAKLGWDYLGERLSLNANDRAVAAMSYADHRLAEMEQLAYQNSDPNQINEAQRQYVHGLELSLYYANDQKFDNYVAVYSHLSDQRDRVFRLEQYSFISGQRGLEANYILNRLDAGVYTMAPKVPGAQVVPSSPNPPTPTPTPTPQP